MDAGIPIIASNVGGIPELIPKRHHADILFGPTPEDLAKRIREILESGMTIASPLMTAEERTIDWVEFHISVLSSYKPLGHAVVTHSGSSKVLAHDFPPPTPDLLTDICIAHSDENLLLVLESSIASILSQSIATIPQHTVTVVILVSTRTKDEVSGFLLSKGHTHEVFRTEISHFVFFSFFVSIFHFLFD